MDSGQKCAVMDKNAMIYIKFEHSLAAHEIEGAGYALTRGANHIGQVLLGNADVEPAVRP